MSLRLIICSGFLRRVIRWAGWGSGLGNVLRGVGLRRGRGGVRGGIGGAAGGGGGEEEGLAGAMGEWFVGGSAGGLFGRFKDCPATGCGVGTTKVRRTPNGSHHFHYGRGGSGRMG